MLAWCRSSFGPEESSVPPPTVKLMFTSGSVFFSRTCLVCTEFFFYFSAKIKFLLLTAELFKSSWFNLVYFRVFSFGLSEISSRLVSCGDRLIFVRRSSCRTRQVWPIDEREAVLQLVHTRVWRSNNERWVGASVSTFCDSASFS